MPAALLIQVLGVLFGCSALSYGVERVPSVHPVVRRGIQVGLCVFAGWYVARLAGVVV